MPRNRTIERALQTSKKGPRIATAVILVLGAIVFLGVLSPTERKRRSVMSDLEIGDDSTAVVEALGPPVRCALRSPEVVRAGFPTDWPPPTVEATLARLQQTTAQRWVYAINLRKRLPCGTKEEHTEVGIGRDGRVLWYIAVTGKTTIRLPDEYTPSGGGS